MAHNRKSESAPAEEWRGKTRDQTAKRTKKLGLDPGFAGTLQRGGAASDDYDVIRREKEKNLKHKR
jgi:hypothetical protein